MMKANISRLESTEIQKKCLGLTSIFFDEVYPKEHKIAHMEKFLSIIYELIFLEKGVFCAFIKLILSLHNYPKFILKNIHLCRKKINFVGISRSFT